MICGHDYDDGFGYCLDDIKISYFLMISNRMQHLCLRIYSNVIQHILLREGEFLLVMPEIHHIHLPQKESMGMLFIA